VDGGEGSLVDGHFPCPFIELSAVAWWRWQLHGLLSRATYAARVNLKIAQ